MSHDSEYIAMRIIRESPRDNELQFDKFCFKGDGLVIRMNH